MHPEHCLSRIVRAALYSLPLYASFSAGASDVMFDTSIMSTRGLSADLNNYFSSVPRFLPGVHTVQVRVNDKGRGTAAVRFGEDGSLCIDNDFIEFAGLMPVPLKSNEQCHQITEDYPKAVVNALPGSESVELYLPEEALSNLSGEIKSFQHGGTAGLINYSMFSTRSESEGSATNRYSQASLEAGFNMSDWMLRSNYILTDDNGDKNAESIFTFAEHVFVAYRTTMQVGEINARSEIDLLPVD